MTEGKRTAAPASSGTNGLGAASGHDPAAFGALYGQTMLELQREWLAGMGEMHRDYLTFIGERMRKDIEAAKRLAECRDLQAAMELQSAFVEAARDDYLGEAQRLLAMGSTLAQSCAERLAETPARANGDISPD